jgi:acetyl-CoA acyltransferase
MSQHKAVIVDGVRSPMGNKKGNMIGIHAHELMAQVINSLLDRNKTIKKDEIADLVLGCAFPEASQGMLMARGVAVLCGLDNTPGVTVNRFCGSSMESVHEISRAIECGDYEVAIAAGVEDMFSVPMGGFNPSFHPELAKKNFYISMGETAETLAKESEITRDMQEEFAMESHKRALSADFSNEVIPISFNGKTISKDETPMEPNVEKIKSLKPAFTADGTVTAATSSPITIGAAAMLICSEEYAKKNNLNIRGRITGRSTVAVDWTRMGHGPVPAVEKLMKMTGKKWEDIDAFEINEAFSAQVLHCTKAGNWPAEKRNLNGGAVALGHPLGCSGVRILVTLLNVLEQNKGKRGLATACIGTGQGIATMIELA